MSNYRQAHAHLSDRAEREAAELDSVMRALAPSVGHCACRQGRGPCVCGQPSDLSWCLSDAAIGAIFVATVAAIFF